MGKKYIIELLDDCPSEFKGIIVFGLTPEGQISAEPIPVEDLTPYTAPDLEQVKADAYLAGLKDGQEVTIESQNNNAYNDGYKKGFKDGEEKAHQRGMDDANRNGEYNADDGWYVMQKISLLPNPIKTELFGTAETAVILQDNSFKDALAKLTEYEQRQEEQIQVGDEVENTQTGVKFIVTHLWENNHGEQGVSGFNQECSAFSTTLSLVVKTGRTFPEIATVLEKMKES